MNFYSTSVAVLWTTAMRVAKAPSAADSRRKEGDPLSRDVRGESQFVRCNCPVRVSNGTGLPIR